jgi:hypothetical protein
MQSTILFPTYSFSNFLFRFQPSGGAQSAESLQKQSQYQTVGTRNQVWDQKIVDDQWTENIFPLYSSPLATHSD